MKNKLVCLVKLDAGFQFDTWMKSKVSAVNVFFLTVWYFDSKIQVSLSKFFISLLSKTLLKMCYT